MDSFLRPFSGMAIDESWLLIASASNLQKLLTAGELSSVDIVKTAFSQVARYDRQGPNLPALVSSSSVALTVAEQLDQEWASGYFRDALHGIPIILKASLRTYLRCFHHTSTRFERTSSTLAPRWAFIRL